MTPTVRPEQTSVSPSNQPLRRWRQASSSYSRGRNISDRPRRRPPCAAKSIHAQPMGRHSWFVLKSRSEFNSPHVFLCDSFLKCKERSMTHASIPDFVWSVSIFNLFPSCAPHWSFPLLTPRFFFLLEHIWNGCFSDLNHKFTGSWGSFQEWQSEFDKLGTLMSVYVLVTHCQARAGPSNRFYWYHFPGIMVLCLPQSHLIQLRHHEGWSKQRH